MGAGRGLLTVSGGLSFGNQFSATKWRPTRAQKLQNLQGKRAFEALPKFYPTCGDHSRATACIIEIKSKRSVATLVMELVLLNTVVRRCGGTLTCPKLVESVAGKGSPGRRLSGLERCWEGLGKAAVHG